MGTNDLTHIQYIMLKFAVDKLFLLFCEFVCTHKIINYEIKCATHINTQCVCCTVMSHKN